MLEFFRMFKRYFWILIITVVISTFAAIYLNFFYLEKIYSSTSSLFVMHKDTNEGINSYQNLLASDMLVKDFKEILISGMIIQELQNSLKDNIPWFTSASKKEILDKIDVSIKSETRIIQIKVEDTDPVNAAQIANTIASIFIKKIPELLEFNNVKVLSEAQPADEPDSPKPVRDSILIIIGGIMLGIALIIFINNLYSQIEAQKISYAKKIETQKLRNTSQSSDQKTSYQENIIIED